MNKKKVYILSLILLLMVVIMVMQQFFSEDIKKVAFRNNKVSAFTEYKVGNEKYKMLLPKEWTIEEERENIDEKELELRFNSDKIEGNITILNNFNSIDEVNSKIFKDVTHKKYYEYKNNNLTWNVVDYEVKENINNINHKCYFRKCSEGKVILIDFEYDNGKTKPSMEVVFEKIVDNFICH